MDLAASQLIKIYMHTEILIGNIFYAPTPEARLLDTLNGLGDRGPVKRGRFIELNDVTIQHLDGRKEKLKTSYINKTTIQIAITLGDAEASRGMGAQEGAKSYPFIEKSPLPVRIETQDYVITGFMFHLTYQDIWHVLEDTPAFLPITHAQILTTANGAQETVPFVAINKEHILALQEENEKPKTAVNINKENPKKAS